MSYRTAFALVALVVSFAAAPGCASGPKLAPAVQEALDVADCQLEAVRALVPHVETADAVVAAARAGDTRAAIALLLQLGMQPEEIAKVGKAFAACLPKAPEALPAVPAGVDG